MTPQQQNKKTISMTILLTDCPALPSVNNYYAHILKPVICDLNTTCLKNPHDYDHMQSLLDRVPHDSRLEVMSRFLFYFLQCCRLPFDDDIKQSVRIMNILKLSPQSASARDSEGMTSLHYYCMRGTSDLDILHRLLEINRDLPGIENNFGETPLHQVVGQIRPNPAVVAAFLKACPSAFKQASQSSRKYPLHVILANTRLNSNPWCMKSAELVMEGYPEAATIEVQEDRLILQVLLNMHIYCPLFPVLQTFIIDLHYFHSFFLSSIFNVIFFDIFTFHV
jgi:hypothetical protein